MASCIRGVLLFYLALLSTSFSMMHDGRQPCNLQCGLGVCDISDQGHPYCDCFPNWYGHHCDSTIEVYPGECGPYQCVHGKCIINSDYGATGDTWNTQHRCECETGWTGHNCTRQAGTGIVIDALHYCGNYRCIHGECILDPSNGDLWCQCEEGWTGDSCTAIKDVDPTSTTTTTRKVTTMPTTTTTTTTTTAPPVQTVQTVPFVPFKDVCEDQPDAICDPNVLPLLCINPNLSPICKRSCGFCGTSTVQPLILSTHVPETTSSTTTPSPTTVTTTQPTTTTSSPTTPTTTSPTTVSTTQRTTTTPTTTSPTTASTTQSTTTTPSTTSPTTVSTTQSTMTTTTTSTTSPTTVSTNASTCGDDPEMKCNDPMLLTMICADPTMANKYCKDSCGLCLPPCEDDPEENCADRTLLTFICGHSEMADKYCKRSCGLCPEVNIHTIRTTPFTTQPKTTTRATTTKATTTQPITTTTSTPKPTFTTKPPDTTTTGFVFTPAPEKTTTTTKATTTQPITTTTSTPKPTFTTKPPDTTTTGLVFTPAPEKTTVVMSTNTTTSSLRSTTKGPYQLPNVTTTCAVCDGPSLFCEQLYKQIQCHPPNNYCINHVINHNDGSRTVTRGCGNFDTCYRDWFQGSSDNDRCQLFDGVSLVTINFDCTYCCTKDGCNTDLRPPTNTLYMDQ